MGVQIPRGFHPEVSKERALRLLAQRTARRFAPPVTPEGWRDCRGPLDARPRPYAAEHPAKHSVAHVIGFMNGKSSIWIAQNIKNRRRNFAGHKFWARGYFVSTVGANERIVRNYIQMQQQQDKRLDDLFNR